MKFAVILFFIFLSSVCNASNNVSVTEYGVVGDGIVDDTVAFQSALTYCAINQTTCIIPGKKKVRITAPVYLWGKTNLVGERGSEIQPDLIDITQRFIVNLGISGILQPEIPFTGMVKGITFRVLSGPTDKWLNGEKTIPIAGRVIQCWNCEFTKIKGNVFEIGEYFYGATASQINGAYMFGLGVKHDITIEGNIINQSATFHGQECIGISNAQDIVIKNNHCTGAGDDLIGAHFVDGITINDNVLRGVDGRIFLASTSNAIVKGNHVERMASTLDGQWYQGSTLVYVGYEYPARQHPRSENVIIQDNVLVLPESAIDAGAVISIRGATNVLVKDNVIRNDSASVTSHGIWIAPWRDPSTPVAEYELYYIEDVSIIGNKMSGDYPLKIVMTDQCVGYRGFVNIIDNDGEIGVISCPKVVNFND
jgi:hypothetical protein